MENCTYCGDYATTRDHFVPWSYNHSGERKHAFRNEADNLVPACLQCNAIAGNKVFDTIEDKRDFISARLEKKYRKLIRLPDWTEEQLKTLGVKLRNNTKLKLMAKKWVLNRIAYPTVIYPEEPIRAELNKILKLYE